MDLSESNSGSQNASQDRQGENSSPAHGLDNEFGAALGLKSRDTKGKKAARGKTRSKTHPHESENISDNDENDAAWVLGLDGSGRLPTVDNATDEESDDLQPTPTTTTEQNKAQHQTTIENETEQSPNMARNGEKMPFVVSTNRQKVATSATTNQRRHQYAESAASAHSAMDSAQSDEEDMFMEQPPKGAETLDADAEVERIQKEDAAHYIREKWDRTPFQPQSQMNDLSEYTTAVKSEDQTGDNMQFVPHISGNGDPRSRGGRRAQDGLDEEDEDEASVYDPDRSDNEAFDAEPAARRKRTQQKGKGRATASEAPAQIDKQQQLDAELTDLHFQLNIARLNLQRLQTKAEHGSLKPSEKAKMTKFEKECSTISATISQKLDLLESATVIGDVEDEVDRTDRSGPSTSSAQKRASSAGRGQRSSLSPHSKRRKTSSRSRTIQSRKAIGKEESRQILGQLFMKFAGSEQQTTAEQLAQVPMNGPINARNIEEWRVGLKEKMAKNPAENYKRTTADHRLLQIARTQFGRKRCRTRDDRDDQEAPGQWVINGMKSMLLNYQFAGAGWMIRRERSKEGPQGGILADDMGLGKTVEALSVIVGNPPREEDKSAGRGVTLIVVPTNALEQWEDEITRHCQDIFVTIMKGKRHKNPNDIKPFMIVLTTYMEVVKSYPSHRRIQEIQREASNDAEVRNLMDQEFGLLHRVEWYRVILDEAHMIKNPVSQYSKACVALRKKFGWALSGTPIMNADKEFFPYTEFLEVNFARNQAQFVQIVKTPEGQQELARLVKKVLMMRDKNSLFLGERLVALPKPHFKNPRWVKFSKPEEFLYRRLESHFREQFNKLSKRGQLKQSKRRLVNLALRLRQAVSHDYLLGAVIEEHLPDCQIALIRTKLAEFEAKGIPFVRDMKLVCERRLSGKNEKTFVDPMDAPDDIAFGESRFGNLTFSLDKQLDMVQRKRAAVAHECAFCSSETPETEEADCGHHFCETCVRKMVKIAMDDGKASVMCPNCGTDWDIPENLFDAHSQRGDSAAPQERVKKARSRIRTAKPRMIGDDVHGLQPKAGKGQSMFLDIVDQDPSVDVTPSAKTATAIGLVSKWIEKHPGDKIIIFTQFILTGKILARALQQENINFLTYFGCYTADNKNWALDDFKKRDDIPVLIASLHCCAVALNLACANHAILIDLWWNHAVEQQAFARIYRIGQEKETFFWRILVENTIDHRLLALQAKKLANIAKVLKEFDSVSQDLSEEEIGSLLGRVYTDESGHLVVESDYEDDTDDEEDEEDEDVE